MVEVYYGDDTIEIIKENFSKMWDDICPICHTETLTMYYMTESGDGAAWNCTCCNKSITWVG